MQHARLHQHLAAGDGFHRVVCSVGVGVGVGVAVAVFAFAFAFAGGGLCDADFGWLVAAAGCCLGPRYQTVLGWGET